MAGPEGNSHLSDLLYSKTNGSNRSKTNNKFIEKRAEIPATGNVTPPSTARYDHM